MKDIIKKILGFTMIELIVVIVILGILAAYVVVKFMDVDKEAREATVESMRGAVISAADIVRVMAATKGTETDAEGEYVLSRGTKVYLGSSEYPLANSTGIGVALSFDGFDCEEDGDSYVCEREGAPTQSSCKVVYTYDATSLKAVPEVDDPFLEGC